MIETVVYRVATNKTTGEVSYTPQGVYDAVATPELTGYTNSGDVAELIPGATMTEPEDSVVTVTYQAVSQPGDGGSGNGSGNGSGDGTGTGTNPSTPGTGSGDNGSGTSTGNVSGNNSSSTGGGQLTNVNTTNTSSTGATNGKLPQTDDDDDKTSAVLGMSLLGLTLGLFGFKRRKRDEK